MNSYMQIKPDWAAIRDPNKCRGPFGSDPQTVERNAAGIRLAGVAAGERLTRRLKGKKVLLVGGPADFEGYASGIQAALERDGNETKVACLWMATSALASPERPVARQIFRSYIDVDCADCTTVVSAHNVIDEAATATAALLWASYKAPHADLFIAVHRVSVDQLDELKDEAETCFGRPLEAYTDKVYANDKDLLEDHPYPSFRERDDNIAHTPRLVQARRELRAAAKSPRLG